MGQDCGSPRGACPGARMLTPCGNREWSPDRWDLGPLYSTRTPEGLQPQKADSDDSDDQPREVKSAHPGHRMKTERLCPENL